MSIARLKQSLRDGLVFETRNFRAQLGVRLNTNCLIYKYTVCVFIASRIRHYKLRGENKFTNHFRIDLVPFPLCIECNKHDGKIRGFVICFIRVVWFRNFLAHILDA